MSPSSRDLKPQNTTILTKCIPGMEKLPVDVLPKTWTRAAMLIRVNSLIKGASSVRPVIVERLLDLLKLDIIPIIPLHGSISASGDLSPLSYIGGAIQGKPTIRIHGEKDQYADQAFAREGLSPLTLEPKEGLAIVNVTAISTAAAALSLNDNHTLSLLAQILTALSCEALLGTVESFDPFFSEVRPHPGQVETAKNLRTLLHASKLVRVNDGTDSSLRQDRYSIRTAPQWLGPVLENTVLAHQQITIELNSATDNPLESQGRMLHGGNFQALAVTSAMEKVRHDNYYIGRMLFAQCTEMINPSTSRGLPPNLVADNPSTSFIFKGTDINMASLQAELGFLSSPMNHVQSAEMGNQSLNWLALISARYMHKSNEILLQMAAVHLIAVCQALDIRVLNTRFFDAVQSSIAKALEDHLGAIDTFSSHKQDLLETMSKALEKAFDTTVSLDSAERFVNIANAMVNTLRIHPASSALPDPWNTMGKCEATIADKMLICWNLQRDAYLAHGDAGEYLGAGTREMYNFVRQDLKVPILHREKIQTPQLDGEVVEMAFTVGSYNSIVYEAIRDGRVRDVIQRCLNTEKV